LKTAELTGAMLDYWVAKAEGHAEVELTGHSAGGNVKRQFCEVVLPGEDGQEYWTEYDPSKDWARGGPIIEREKISVIQERYGNDEWEAGRVRETGEHHYTENAMFGPTPLIAAMRAFVASKFGDEVPPAARPTAQTEKK
jgi:hypothetical protein